MQVLPRLGQQIHSQNAPPAVEPLERSHQEVSSGAGELSDSVSVPEFGATNFQKKRNRVRNELCEKNVLFYSILLILMLGANNLGFRAKLKSDEPAYLSPVTPIMTPGGIPLLRVGFMKLIFD